MGAFKNDGRHYDKTFTTALTGGKTSKPGFARGKPYNRALRCTPIPACGGTSPDGGSLLSAELLFS